MTEYELKKSIIMTDYKNKIDALVKLYSQDEIDESKTVNNEYRQRINELKAERSVKISEI